MFYMGGTVSKGRIVVPDGNESIHTSGLLFILTDGSSRNRGKHARLEVCTCTYTCTYPLSCETKRDPK